MSDPIEDFSHLPKTRAEARAAGVKLFFSGKMCRRGHFSPRYRNDQCIVCAQEDHIRRKDDPVYVMRQRRNARKNSKERREAKPEETRAYARALHHRWKFDPEYREQRAKHARASADRDVGRYLLRLARKRAVKVCVPFELTSIDIPECCPCCHVVFQRGVHGKSTETSPTMDRLDSSRGYVPDNVNIICMRCNRIKNSGTVEDHRRIADWMESVLDRALV